MRMKSRVIEIVNIVSLKFASDEAAGCKVDILEPLFYSQLLAMPDLSIETSLPNPFFFLPNTTVVLLELRLLSRCKTRKEVCA